MKAADRRQSTGTTPAGRFEAEPGINNKGEQVVWVDYDSAFAIHRLRPGFAYQSRATRLVSTRQSSSSADRSASRISGGS